MPWQSQIWHLNGQSEHTNQTAIRFWLNAGKKNRPTCCIPGTTCEQLTLCTWRSMQRGICRCPELQEQPAALEFVIDVFSRLSIMRANCDTMPDTSCWSQRATLLHCPLSMHIKTFLFDSSHLSQLWSFWVSLYPATSLIHSWPFGQDITTAIAHAYSTHCPAKIGSPCHLGSTDLP
jgi:hypothetical protein